MKPALSPITGLGSWLAGRLEGRLVGVTHRPKFKSVINRQGLGDRSILAGLIDGKLMADCELSGLELTGFKLTASRIDGSELVGSGLAGSFGLLGSGLLLFGDQEDNELHCRLLKGLLDNISVSVELLLIKLLLSRRLLLWLLALLLGYSESDIMMLLIGDVVDRMVGERVMFFTLFNRWLEQTVNLPGEGGGQSS
jgi:hypothetical protein